MSRSLCHHRAARLTGVAAIFLGLIGTAALDAGAVSAGAPPPSMTFTPNVRADTGESGTNQNEPQVTVDQSGKAFVGWQGGPNSMGSSSTTDGSTFTYLGNPDTTKASFSDVAWATTSWPKLGVHSPVDTTGNNGIFWTGLGQGTCGAIEMRGSTSKDQGAHWAPVDATCQPGQVDRNWTAAYTPPQYRGTDGAVSHTWVYNEYHDFGTSNIWVSRSSNGGASYDPIQYTAIQPGSSAFLTTTCNTIPSGIAVDQNGAHAGRVYVTWETSDVPQNGAGCNYTQAQPFDHIFTSYSDDNGATWTSVNVFNDPCAPTPPVPPTSPTSCQDLSELFNSTAVDDAGNVYVSFTFRDITQPTPEYDVYVARSGDGGQTWTRHKVNTDTGTHYMPWVVAGGNGGLDIAFYRTPYVEGVGTNNKPAAAPQSAVWDVFLAQSLDGGSTFLQNQVSDHHIYFGDICSTGIFCTPASVVFGWGTDRTLYDVFGAAIGPDGGARIAWTDASASWNGTCSPTGTGGVGCQQTHIEFACQKSGTGLHGETITGCGQGTLNATPARVSRFQATQRGKGLQLTWRMAVTPGVLGFNLWARNHRLNAHPIGTHTARGYHFSTTWIGHGPYHLEVLLVNGQRLSVAAH